MQPGRSVYRQLEHSVEQYRRDVDAQVARMDELDRSVSELVARRGHALTDLSKHYLPDISADSVRNSFHEVRNDLEAILAQKQRRQRELQDQAAAAERDAEHREAELDRVTEQLNERVSQREALEKVVSERLHASDEFKRLSADALAAEQELERNEDRVSQMKDEAERKLPSYDRSKLFKYLYDSGYGTPKYAGKGWTKQIDAWVAKMIDYHAAKQGYDFLRVTPELMTQEVGRRRDKFNQLMGQVEAIEDKVADEVGLTEVMRQGQEFGAQRDRMVKDSEQAETRVAQLQQNLAKLDGVDNEFYAQAVARMTNFLMNVPPHELAAHSQSTPERQDDAIVAEVSFLQRQLDDAQRNGAALAHDRQFGSERLAGLTQVLNSFRSAEFDSQRSMFDDRLDVTALLSQYVDGRLTAQQLWDLLRQAQQFSPLWPENPTHSRDWTDVVTSDASIALLRVLTTVAGEALRHAAYRGVQRRAEGRQQRRVETGRPPFPKRGFTRGRGF